MGLFVTFEGIEGSGKSTQARMLKRRLERRAYQVTMTYEPGGTALGARLRRLLKYGETVTPVAEVLLFAASRAQLVREVIRPQLGKGNVVLCDRFTDSTKAYQGYGRGIDLAAIDEINRHATGGLAPHLTVLLDVPPEQGLRRKPGKPDRFEREGLAFHRRVRKGYLELARKEPDRWLVIDGAKPKAEVAAEIWSKLSEVLGAKG